ncbi:hypothetical protein [Natronorubrum sulfidifaciens]|uniref:Uncharacterized protein n=1 Tax=Natronorubrum sulfidifaciens JCM 14089 TaxID=1230460 RepID=L9WBP6_9EURY|nr:hypothetical protein [Natronorubrum sulfidifaciens]ELY46782.1 hypothetical protein C495_06728 [Natronorubrum sulfidifaciens JCM 14089]
MTSPAAERLDDRDVRTLELPATATTQRALHEAVGHLYDELAIADERSESDSELPNELFAQLETLYVATAEESAADLEFRYRLEDDSKQQ